MSTESTALVTIEMVETELAVLQNIKAEDLFIETTITPILDNIEKHVRSIPQDISTAKGRQEIISLAAKVCSTKTFIDGVRMKLTEGWRTQTATVNASGKKSKERLQKLQDETRQPMTEWENIEKERIAKLELGIVALEAFGTFEYSVTTEEIAVRLDNLEHCATDSFEDFSRRAEAAKQGSLGKLRSMLAVSQQRDKERAELEALRKQAAERAAEDERQRVEKENREREEARAKAEKERAEAYALVLVNEANAKAEKEKKDLADKVEAERLRIENEKRDADERAANAERDRVQAIEDARIAAEQAENARIAAEAKAKQDIADALEAKRLQDEATAEAERKAQEKRENNSRHVAKVDREIVAALSKLGYDETTSKALIAAIVAGKVPHCAITY